MTRQVTTAITRKLNTIKDVRYQIDDDLVQVFRDHFIRGNLFSELMYQVRKKVWYGN